MGSMLLESSDHSANGTQLSMPDGARDRSCLLDRIKASCLHFGQRYLPFQPFKDRQVYKVNGH